MLEQTLENVSVLMDLAEAVSGPLLVLGSANSIAKHIFLQFTFNNTVLEQTLENVSVGMDLAEAVHGPSGLLYCFFLPFVGCGIFLSLAGWRWDGWIKALSSLFHVSP